MERYTETIRSGSGERLARVIGQKTVYSETQDRPLAKAICRLSEYEELGLTPKELRFRLFGKANAAPETEKPVTGNLFELARAAGMKQFMFTRDSWGKNSYGICEKVAFKLGTPYGTAWGHCEFASGTKTDGKIANAGTFSWQLIKVLDENLVVVPYVPTGHQSQTQSKKG